MTKSELIEALESLDADAEIALIFDGEDYEIDGVARPRDVDDDTQNIVESKRFAYIIADI